MCAAVPQQFKAKTKKLSGWRYLYSDIIRPIDVNKPYYNRPRDCYRVVMLCGRCECARCLGIKRADIGSFFTGDLLGRGSACSGDGCGGSGGALTVFGCGRSFVFESLSRTGLEAPEEVADDEVTDEEGALLYVVLTTTQHFPEEGGGGGSRP